MHNLDNLAALLRFKGDFLCRKQNRVCAEETFLCFE
jgi:hypothetical protein